MPLVYIIPLVVSIVFWVYLRTNVLYAPKDFYGNPTKPATKIPRGLIMLGIGLAFVPILNIVILTITILVLAIIMFMYDVIEFEKSKINKFLVG